MRAKELLAAGLFLSAAPSAWSVEPVTAQNWRRHPAVLEVKAIYHEVRQAVAAGRLRQLRWVFGGCQLHEERVLNRERGYAIRSYHWIGSSEDSWSQFAYYYDRGGRLRFVLMKAGAANGTRLERRIYLSKGGKQLWEAETRTGPGWTFPETGLVHDPSRISAETVRVLCTEGELRPAFDAARLAERPVDDHSSGCGGTSTLLSLLADWRPALSLW